MLDEKTPVKLLGDSESTIIYPADRRYVHELHLGECHTYSSFSVDYIQKMVTGLAKWCGITMEPIDWGGCEGYDVYQRLLIAGAARARRSGLRCEVRLVPQLYGLEGLRVSVVARDGATRVFTVGISGGWLPRHLESADHLAAAAGDGIVVYGLPFQSVSVVGDSWPLVS